MKIGIYQSYWGRVGGGQRYIAVVAQWLAQSHDVEIVHHHAGFTPSLVEEPMGVDLRNVVFRFVPRRVRPNWTGGPFRRLRQEREWCRDISEGYDLFIDSSDNVPFFCHAKYGVLLTHFPLVTFDHFHSNGHGRSGIRSLLTHVYHRLEWKQRFSTYDHTIVNSEFTQHWTKRYWGVNSSIVYPPLREGLTPSEVKQPRVLTIGAFYAAQHKKHEVTVNAFRQMCDAGVVGWEYVLMGACGKSPEDTAYVNHLKELACGYPVRILTDVSGAELKELIETSSILWHAMGYGVDPEQNPGRMEHFGMVATEALAAGTVPVVFNGGGLPEIVEDGSNGFLWTTPEQLVSATQRLIENPELLRRIRQNSVESSQRFANEAFERRLSDALCPFLST